MRLTEERRARFERGGCLFIPSLFAPDEVRTLADAVIPRTSSGPVDFGKLAA